MVIFDIRINFFLLPVVVRHEWHNALFVMGGLSFSCVIFGALMRPLELKNKEPKKKEVKKLPGACAELVRYCDYSEWCHIDNLFH